MKILRASSFLGIVLLVSVGCIGCLSQIMQQGTSGRRLLDYALAAMSTDPTWTTTLL